MIHGSVVSLQMESIESRERTKAVCLGTFFKTADNGEDSCCTICAYNRTRKHLGSITSPSVLVFELLRTLGMVLSGGSLIKLHNVGS